MIQSPCQPRPACSVPQTAEQEYHNGVANVHKFAATASSQGEIYIIPEPCGKGDVPATPEVRDAGSQIGIVEVLGELNAKQACCSYSNIAVS